LLECFQGDYFSVDLSTLEQFHEGCTTDLTVSPTALYADGGLYPEYLKQCTSASSRYCQSLGYPSGAPQQTLNYDVGVSCMTAGANLGVSFAEMTAQHEDCTFDDVLWGPGYSKACEAAASGACVANGHAGGGLIVEVDGDSEVFGLACIDG
jgi:hypothetical protein